MGVGVKVSNLGLLNFLVGRSRMGVNEGNGCEKLINRAIVVEDHHHHLHHLVGSCVGSVCWSNIAQVGGDLLRSSAGEKLIQENMNLS